MSDELKPDSAAERIPEIFETAVEMESPEERTAYLEDACAGDSEIRTMVERLLASHDEAEDFFQEGSPTQISATEITQTLAEIPDFFSNVNSAFPDDDEVGKQIGNYKLLKKIGEGGVGNVYLAEQTRPVRRQVAFKIIKAGMDTRSVIARFEAERQALAMMEHPHIAHVLNAGETDAGRPFFVMDLVHGERITTYCDEARLSVNQRLELFVQVCHAIQHAHQKGVIHRDIKPSNVLIKTHDGVPSPVVIDFGIAKAAGENMLTDKTINTSMGPIIGTPAYMSPEQTNLKQDNVDTRSDIYSLGVLLYELLISRPPFQSRDLLKAGLDEMCRIIREKEPLSPSAKFRQMSEAERAETARNRNLDPRRLPALLAHDLEWIVLKAMEKARERRYESAGELAADIQRFIGNEPVSACPPSRLYQFKKLVARNRAVSLSAAVISLVLVVCLAATSWLYVREHEARKRAVLAERQQQVLRVQAEDRERIAQAAFLIGQGEVERADELVEKVANVTPSLETETVLRTLGEWYALKGKWSAAASRFRLLLKADIKDNAWTITDDLLKAGPVLIEQGDVAGYESFRHAAIAMYQNTDQYTFAERTMKISLLMPVDAATLADLESLEALLFQVCRDVVVFDGMRAWGAMSLALMEYRKGEWAGAVDWSRRCRNSVDAHPVRISITHLIQAMALQQQGRADEAWDHLRLGRAPVRDAFSRPLEKGTMEGGFWYDWIFARILLREAETLLIYSSDGGE